MFQGVFIKPRHCLVNRVDLHDIIQCNTLPDDEFCLPEVPIKKHSLANNFLKANCQIVLNPGISSYKFTKDPNIGIPFENILFIIKPRDVYDFEFQCPICLSEPSPPVITKCGHVFCWPCIVSCALASGSSISSCNCPICTKMVILAELRIVLWRFFESFNIGSAVSFSLFNRRLQTSYIIENDSTDNSIPSIPDSFVELYPGSLFLPILCPVGESVPSFQQTQVLECTFKTEAVINILQQIKDSLLTKISNCDSELIRDSISKCLSSLDNHIYENCQHHNWTRSSEDSIPIGHSVKFYQLLNGNHVYLDPVCVQQLSREFLSQKEINLDVAPTTVEGVITHITKHIMTKDMYKRYNFLSHVPLKTEITFYRINMTNPPLKPLPFIPEVSSKCQSVKSSNPYIVPPKDSFSIISLDTTSTSVNSIESVDIESTEDFPLSLNSEGAESTKSFSHLRWESLNPPFHNEIRSDNNYVLLDGLDNGNFAEDIMSQSIFGNTSHTLDSENLLKTFSEVVISKPPIHESKKSLKRRLRRANKTE